MENSYVNSKEKKIQNLQNNLQLQSFSHVDKKITNNKKLSECLSKLNYQKEIMLKEKNIKRFKKFINKINTNNNNNKFNNKINYTERNSINYNNNNKNIIKDDLILKENIHNNLTSIHNKFVSLLKYKEENKKNERYIKSIPTRKSKNFLHILKSNESNKKLNNHGRVKSVDNNNINNNNNNNCNNNCNNNNNNNNNFSLYSNNASALTKPFTNNLSNESNLSRNNTTTNNNNITNTNNNKKSLTSTRNNSKQKINNS